MRILGVFAHPDDECFCLHKLARLGPGQFFGEMALARRQPRSANVIAVDNVTCVIFSYDAASAFAGRGPGAPFTPKNGSEPDDKWLGGADTCVDVTAHVAQKIAAIAAHRTQYPIEPSMFPMDMLRQMLGHEYFVRVLPPAKLETDLFTMSEGAQSRRTQSSERLVPTRKE